MSFTRQKKERIINYILEQVEKDAENMITKTASTMDVSHTTVRRYLKELLEHKVVTGSNRKCLYELVSAEKNFTYNNSAHLEEHAIYFRDILPLLKGLPDNVEKIWAYSFMEMMNNAIEHSGSAYITCRFIRNALNTKIIIMDKGVGIFHKIQAYILAEQGIEVTVRDAAVELFKGKLTTAKEGHSGEGIFFTSRIMDTFVIMSDETLFTHDNIEDALHDLSKIDIEISKREGTFVLLGMLNSSHKEAKEVFDMFSSSDDGFVKTQIPIKQICEYGYPIARSQARRLYSRFDKFKEVVLDFADVEDLGQAFAHEIYVVYVKAHPSVIIHTIHANAKVSSMINHVKKTNI
ncbi:MAG: STAS-like domain-containing protein [Lachnospiraceae bacterium]|nr:STAS-like domain-containing protein [Lachnospiraceae bacterium]